MQAESCPLFPLSAADTGASLIGRSATELAGLVAAGSVTALECVEAHIARIEEVNPSLNAVVVKRYDAARAEAREVDRRRAAGQPLPLLAGVPVTIKECLDLEGTASTFGLANRAGHIARADGPQVARLRAAGAIILGKTNVSQLLMYVESDNPVYGRSNNPHNLARSCGGSSGGEGAIIAAGGSALGLGTDIGGSVRIPAAFCGLASMKPTAGRSPDPGEASLPLGQTQILSQVGVLARSVDDVALGLRVIDGANHDALIAVPPLADMNSVDVRRLRIGCYTEDGVMPSSPAVRRAVREAAARLRGAGATVVDWQPPTLDEVLHLVFAIFAGDGGVLMKARIGGGPTHPTVQALLGLGGLPVPLLRLLRPLLGALGQPSLADMTRHFGRTRTADFWRITEQLMHYRQGFAQAMDSAAGGPLDLILGPVAALPAFLHGSTRDLGIGGVHTMLYNALGYPAGVVPVTRVRADEENERPESRDVVLKAARRCDLGSAGLPVDVQIAARPWQEHVGLAAMKVLATR